MKYSLIKIYIAATIIFLFSCSDNGASIFYDIELERPITDRNLPNELSIGSLVTNDSSYITAAGNIYIKPHNSTAWVSSSQPGGSRRYMISKVAYVDTHIVAFGAEFDEGTVSVFLSADSGNTWSDAVPFDALSGEPIDILTAYNPLTSAYSSFFVFRLLDVNDNLYRYSLHEITAVPDLQTIQTTQVPLMNAEGLNSGGFDLNKIIDVAIETDGTIWAITPAQALSEDTVGTGLPAEVYYTGIYYSPYLSSLFIATFNSSEDNSTVYRFEAGAWIEDSPGMDTRVYDFGDITVYDGTGGTIQVLSLGTSSGYYEKTALDQAFGAPNTTTDNNYENYDLHDATVFRLESFQNSSDASFDTFALTSKEGLWLNESLSWNQE